VCVCVCVDMLRYIAEQRALLYESYVKCGSDKECRRKLRRKFPSTSGIHELFKKGRSTGSFLGKKPARKNLVLTEETLRKKRHH
jgi:hypothetical protein